MSDFEPSDYAFIGDIHEVSVRPSTFQTHSLTTFIQLIPFEDDAVDMETNPYVTVTGSVSKFNTEDRSFTMTPTQYIVLTHSTSPFPIHAHFADSNSKKRWGADGPKVAVGSTITLGGPLQRVVREHNINKPLQFAQVEVLNIAYLSTRANLPSSPTRMFLFCQ